MSGILTIGVVLQDWFEKESLHRKKNMTMPKK